MSFAWDEYRKLSGWLVNQRVGKDPGEVEALWRSAISRAYYAAYHLSRSLLVMGGVALPDREVHAFVRDQFARSRQIYRQKLGGDLRKLLEYRRSADYDEVFKHGQLGLAAAAANTYCDNIFRHLIAASLE